MNSLAQVHKLPKNTSNNIVFDELLKTVTNEDIEKGTIPETFAYAQLIMWAIKHKKYVPYYEFVKRYDDKSLPKIIKLLQDEKYVVVTFNYAATPRFGFIRNCDELIQIVPSKDGMDGYYL